MQRDPPRGAIRPGPALLRFAQRGVADADLVDARRPRCCDRWQPRAARRSTSPCRPATGVEPHRPGRLPPHARRGQLGRPRGAVPRRGARQGLPRLRRRRAPAGELERSRRTRSSTATHLSAALDTMRSGRLRDAVDELEPGCSPSPPACAARRHVRRRALHLRPELPARVVAARSTWVRCSSSRPPSCPPDSGTRPWSEDDGMTHDEILQGLFDKTLVGNEPEVRRPRQPGPRRGPGARARCCSTR